MGACSVLGMQTLSDSKSFSGFFSHGPKQTMYERVDADEDGEVFITPSGKKYHSAGCFILNNAKEVKQTSYSAAVDVGYKPCGKCNPSN